MESPLALGNMTKPWGDMLYEDEQNRKMAFLRMPRAEWLACVNAYFNTLRGNGAALISALSWFTQMEAERERAQLPVAPVEVDEQTRNWRVWLDMVEDPEKYGSDIAEWMELDEELRRGPKRWRVDSYWNAKVREIEARNTEAATKIQALWRKIQARRAAACVHCVEPAVEDGLCCDCAEAVECCQQADAEEAATLIQSLWRGYQTRDIFGFRFNCGHCLRHVACSDHIGEGIYVCRECKADWDELTRDVEEDGIETCDDCEHPLYDAGTQIGDKLFCGDCARLWAVCPGCEQVEMAHYVCPNHCRNCGEVIEGERVKIGFCSYPCKLEHLDATGACFDCGETFTARGTKVGELYLCPDCVHHWEPCTRCEYAKTRDEPCFNHCRNCGGSMEHATTTLGYCSFDCQYEWQQDNVD